MSDNVISVFSAKSVATILATGGSQSWVVDRARARGCRYAVVCRNAHHPEAEGSEPNGSAFLVGKVSDVVPSTEMPERWLICFSEYALVDVANQWGGRNPVRFWKIGDFDQIRFDHLNWQPMPEAAAVDAATSKGRGLTIVEAKAGLSLTFGVSPSDIEIIIRG